jgi:hypothetical protein
MKMRMKVLLGVILVLTVLYNFYIMGLYTSNANTGNAPHRHESHFDWNDIMDHAYVVHTIDTAETSERRIKTEAQLSRLNLKPPRIEFFVRPLDPEGGHHGCWMAHKEIAKDALVKGYKSIMILEDDIIFSENFLNNYVKYMEPAAKILSGKHWEIFYFTHNVEKMRLLPDPSWQVDGNQHEMIGVSSWATVGYVIRSTALWWLAHSDLPSLPGRTVDGIMHSSRAFSIHPMIATHPDNWSTTINATRRIMWKRQRKRRFYMPKRTIVR